MSKKNEGLWKLAGSNEPLDKEAQDALNEAMNTYTNEDGQTLKEAFDEQIAGGHVMEGHYRIAPTAAEQMQELFTHKYIYVVADNFLFWLEGNKVKNIDYDYPENNLKEVGMIPLSICGIRGNEFEEWVKEKSIKVSGNMIKVINGEEQEILLGILKGDGSEILYS